MRSDPGEPRQAATETRRRPLRACGMLCLAGGLWLLAGDGLDRLRGLAWQREQAALFDAADESPLAEATADRPATPPLSIPEVASRPSSRPWRGDPVARLRVPRVGLDSVIAEGTDTNILRLGPGHLAGSALPGRNDNCIIAGHRDGAFSRLRSVRPGDNVELSEPDGRTHTYRVLHIRVVPKEDTTVLAPSRRPILTLITCYPFEHIGPAPKRLVIVGELSDRSGPA